jgi:fucose permease
MSLHFPLSVALSTKHSAGQPDLAMSRNAYATALGLGAMPFLVGALADLVGMRAAFVLAPLCLVVAAAAVMRLARLERGVPATTPLPTPVLTGS